MTFTIQGKTVSAEFENPADAALIVEDIGTVNGAPFTREGGHVVALVDDPGAAYLELTRKGYDVEVVPEDGKLPRVVQLAPRQQGKRALAELRAKLRATKSPTIDDLLRDARGRIDAKRAKLPFAKGGRP